jgi:hypothetical protein
METQSTFVPITNPVAEIIRKLEAAMEAKRKAQQAIRLAELDAYRGRK